MTNTCICGNEWDGEPGERCPECGRLAIPDYANQVAERIEKGNADG